VERLACVADVANATNGGTHGEVRFFDVDAANATLETSTLEGFCEDGSAACVGGYDYAEASAAGSARAFSASGHWFAFSRTEAAKTSLYWADLSARPFSLTGSDALATDGDTGLLTRMAFSPSERFLLLQRSKTLTLQSLTDANAFVRLSSALETSAPCSEFFPSAPDAYCGNSERAAAFSWSSDSTLIAFKADNELTIVDVTSFPAPISFSYAATSCGSACTDQFAFQPAE
ncbi:MAG TPA: hypothetical protein VEQ58_09160, partial [Polyangiaceae bacterium]|nr:hypothetical protein [Polyangiaceae bacterium]